MLYCGPNESDLDGDSREGGGHVGGGLTCVDRDGAMILSHVQ